MKRIIVHLLLPLTLSQAIMAMNKPTKASTLQQAFLDSMLDKKIHEGKVHEGPIIKYLLEQGANPNCECKDNPSLLHTTVEERRIDLCSLLIQYKANVNACDSKVYQTPLMWITHSAIDSIMDIERRKVLQMREHEICTLLLAHKAHINAQDIHGTTALMFASMNTNEFVKKLFCTHGADLRVKDRLNTNPLSISAIYGHDCRVLIVNSQFYPRYSAQELRQAQARTRARLWALKKIYPGLTNDCKALILQSNPEVWQDACCTPLKIHTKKPDRIIRMPIPVLRIFLNNTLLKGDAFDVIKTIRLLARYKMNQLEPLMRDAHAECITRNLKESSRKMVDPSTLEEQYGNEIRENIQAELQLHTPHQESDSTCTVL